MHEPSETTRALVRGLACNGVPQTRIAEHLGIDPKTLRLHYRTEIDLGLESATAQVANALF